MKAVTQTQLETCVTNFIALEIQTKERKVVRMGFEIVSLFEGYFLMTVTNQIIVQDGHFFRFAARLFGLFN